MPELPTRTPQQNALRIPAVRQAARNAQIRAQPELQSTSHTPEDTFTRRAHGAAPPIVARVRPRMGEPSTPIPRNAHAQNKWHAHTGCTISQTQQVNKRSRQLLLILNKNFWCLR